MLETRLYAVLTRDVYTHSTNNAVGEKSVCRTPVLRRNG